MASRKQDRTSRHEARMAVGGILRPSLGQVTIADDLVLSMETMEDCSLPDVPLGLI